MSDLPEMNNTYTDSKIYMGFPEDLPPHYAYEAVQIFNDCGGFPEFVPNSGTKTDKNSGIWLQKGEERYDIPFFGEENEKLEHKLQKREIYRIMSNFTGYTSPWGCMTGVRPAKIVNVLFNSGATYQEALEELENFYMARSEKAELAVKTACNQESFLKEQIENPKNIAIYVGIPFCPTRCLYCSFTSHPIGKYIKIVDKYLELLEAELRTVVPVLLQKGYNIESLYIGGGTPTSLSEPSFEKFLGFVTDVVKPVNLKEFSLEAGRPDSITPEKLRIAKKAGVTRISVNPQTMNNATLELIGRRHSAEEVISAFEMARMAGFDNINMDIIAGLPGEDLSHFEYTLEKIAQLKPDGLTVHTLSVKRAADLKRDAKAELLRHDITGKMLIESQKCASSMGMIPFYMYRQKNMLGNHENVSYCRPGCESPYNIHIMEEDQTIFAFGAGGVTKICQKDIIRSFNVKSVEDYMKRSEEMAQRKLMLI